MTHTYTGLFILAVHGPVSTPTQCTSATCMYFQQRVLLSHVLLTLTMPYATEMATNRKSVLLIVMYAWRAKGS